MSSLGIWWGLYTSYVGYLNSGTSQFVFGFPLPTALMLFGVFSSGIYLCGLYIWGFRRFIYTQDDEDAYELLRAAAAAGRRSDPQAHGSKF